MPMPELGVSLLNLVVALGAGLLIGAERERRKIEKETPWAAGIRTFAVASLAGAVAAGVGGWGLLAVAVVVISASDVLGRWRMRDAADPDLTTEAALVLTVLLGGLSITEPGAAAAVAVATALLLAARERVHHFVGAVLTEEEVRAALILGAAAIVVLPLLPNRPMGPFAALNPYSIWRLVVLVLAIGAAGHVAVRALGPRYGLPLAGLASGFVSSSATIGVMGARAKRTPDMLGAATAAAVLSTVATVVQMAVVVGAVSPSSLQALTPALGAAGVAAAVYGVVFTLSALRQKGAPDGEAGNAFSLVAALVFATTLSVVLLAAAALREWFGEAGAIAAAAVAGFVDTHSAGISIASLAASGRLTPAETVVPILAGFTTNTVTKMVVAVTTGGRAFAVRVIPGLVLVAVAGWAAALLAPWTS
jgi:uncharacterized membrane protein (DUF4010 family)